MSEDRDLRQDGSLTDPVVPDPGKQDRNRKKRKNRKLKRKRKRLRNVERKK